MRDALGSYGDGGRPLRERPQAPRVTWCDLHPRRGRGGRSACLLPSRPPLLHCAPLALGQRAARQISCGEDQPTALWGPGLEGPQVPAGAGKGLLHPPQSCAQTGASCPSASGTQRFMALSLSLGGGGGAGIPGIPCLLLYHLAPGPDLPRAGGWVTRGRCFISRLRAPLQLGSLQHWGAGDQAGKTVTPGQATGPSEPPPGQETGPSLGLCTIPVRRVLALPRGPPAFLCPELWDWAGLQPAARGKQAGLAGRDPEPSLPQCGSS